MRAVAQRLCASAGGRAAFVLAGLVAVLLGARLLAQSYLGAPLSEEPGAVSGKPAPKPTTEVRPAQPASGASAVLPGPVVAAAQPPRPPMPMSKSPSAGDGDLFQSRIRLDVPGPEVLFRLEPESALILRIQEEARQRKKTTAFPDTRIFLGAPLVSGPRAGQPMREIVEPSYLAFRRLYFQEINSQRYGWEMGVFQPLISTGVFYLQFLSLPYQFVAEPCRRWEYNTGWCLPGDPVPLVLYPPRPK